MGDCPDCGCGTKWQEGPERGNVHKLAVPIRRLKRKFFLDVGALRRAMEAGTLSDADRALAERILPGVTLPREQMVAGLQGIARKAEEERARAPVAVDQE